MGVRYFRFQESLSVSAINTDVAIGGGDAYFNDTVTNNLIGPQIGFDLAYNVGCNVRLFINPKVGIYDNFVDSNFKRGAAWVRARMSTAPNTVHGLSQFPCPRHEQRRCVPDANRPRRRLAVRAELERTGWAIASWPSPAWAWPTTSSRNFCATRLKCRTRNTPRSLVLHGAFLGATYYF